MKDKKLNEPTADSAYMFSYTSGTTGDPKGVRLSHKMMTSVSYAVNTRFGPENEVTSKDCYISYLPAAHSFEQCLFGVAVYTGERVGFYGGDVLKLVEDLSILKPTCFPTVPRLFYKIYAKIKDGFAEKNFVLQALINKGLDSKLANLHADGSVTHGFYDRLVFNKAKAILGGNVRIMVTGSAPIAADVLDFLKVCFCCKIIEGYGMTESGGGSFLTMPNESRSGHVGGPI